MPVACALSTSRIFNLCGRDLTNAAGFAGTTDVWKLVPFLWDLDVEACRNIQQRVPEGEDPDSYWDWQKLTRCIVGTASIVEYDPDQSEIPR